MKKNLVLTLLLLAIVATTANAQVTIGSEYNPHSGALLDLKQNNNTGANSNKGLLLPRVELTADDVLTVADASYNLSSTGMWVWNTNPYAPTLEGVGTYQWDGEKWLPIKTAGKKPTPPPTGKLAYRDNDISSNPITGYLNFLTYNLGADPSLSIKQQLLTPSPTTYNTGYANDQAAKDAYFPDVYGSLYQWGRAPDGHQNAWSGIYAGSPAPAPAGSLDDNGQIDQLKDPDRYGKFIKTNAAPNDWLANQNDDLWWKDDAKTVNDPCPDGFRVPSQAEWASIINGQGGGELQSSEGIIAGVNKWVWVDATANTTLASLGFSGEDADATVKTSGSLAYPPILNADNTLSGSFKATPTLFLPAVGQRLYSSGAITNAGASGRYWSRTAIGTAVHIGYFSVSGTTFIVSSTNTPGRTNGFPIRCIKE